jgi:hypothetical protein
MNLSAIWFNIAKGQKDVDIRRGPSVDVLTDRYIQVSYGVASDIELFIEGVAGKLHSSLIFDIAGGFI